MSRVGFWTTVLKIGGLRAWVEWMLRSQPLVPVAVLFIAGIAMQQAFEFGPAVLCVALLSAAAIRPRWRLAGRATALFVVGATLYWARYAPFSENDLRVLLAEEAAIVRVAGVLTETPQPRDFGSNDVTTARLRVSKIRLGGEWQGASGEILTRTRGLLSDDYFPSREVEVAGVIRRPMRAQAPGLFDLGEYLRHQRVFYQLAVDSPAEWKVTREQPTPGIERLRRWAKEQLARGLPEDEQVRMLWAMTLGWRTAMSGEMAEPFVRTGTMHVVAISGLHVACITAMLVISIRVCGVPRFHCAATVVPLVWLYTLMTGWQSSGVRSALMSTALLVGWTIKRPTAMLNSTAAAGLIILAAEPEQLFQVGFQLSFAVVVCIALVTEKLGLLLERDWTDDPFLPRALWPAWKRGWNFVFLKYVGGNLGVSIASFFGALPLTAYYFNLFTPISLLANLVAVPLSSLGLMFSMMSLVVPVLHPITNALSWIFIHETIWVAKFFEKLGGYYYVSKPSPAFLIFYFAVVLLGSSGWLWRAGRRRWAIPLVGALGVCWLVSRGAAESVHVLPMPGSPVWVNLKGRADDLLIDCSSERGFQFGVERFLRGQGIGTLPSLMLTHGDIEHVGGFQLAMERFAPSRIFTSPHSSRSPSHREALRALEALGERWVRAKAGDRIGRWEVLHPATHRFGRADDNAVVLRGEIGGWRVIHIPDLGRDGQRALLRSERELAAEIAIVGPPDNGEGWMDELIERIGAKVVVIGATRGQARKELLVRRFRETHAAIFEVEEEGAVKMEFTKGECVITSMNGRRHVLSLVK